MQVLHTKLGEPFLSGSGFVHRVAIMVKQQRTSTELLQSWKNAIVWNVTVCFHINISPPFEQGGYICGQVCVHPVYNDVFIKLINWHGPFFFHNRPSSNMNRTLSLLWIKCQYWAVLMQTTWRTWTGTIGVFRAAACSGLGLVKTVSCCYVYVTQKSVGIYRKSSNMWVSVCLCVGGESWSLPST